MAEIDQQPKPMAGGLEVIVDLGTVFIAQCGHGLQLDHDSLPASVQRSSASFPCLRFSVVGPPQSFRSLEQDDTTTEDTEDTEKGGGGADLWPPRGSTATPR